MRGAVTKIGRFIEPWSAMLLSRGLERVRERLTRGGLTRNHRLGPTNEWVMVTGEDGRRQPRARWRMVPVAADSHRHERRGLAVAQANQQRT